MHTSLSLQVKGTGVGLGALRLLGWPVAPHLDSYLIQHWAGRSLAGQEPN